MRLEASWNRWTLTRSKPLDDSETWMLAKLRGIGVSGSCVTYWLWMIQRVLMKPFLDHLNCNRGKWEWVAKPQWAVSLNSQTDNYWFLQIICLISLSEQADSPGSPSRLICPDISPRPMSTPSRTSPALSCIYILTSGQKFFGNFSFSTVATLSREPTYLFCPTTALNSLTVRERGGVRVAT